MKISAMLLLSILTPPLLAQDQSLPYYELDKEPQVYTAGAVASRMIDGLGFRFYWATHALRPEDLAYRPASGARTTLETIAHIHQLSILIVNATTKTENHGETQIPAMPFEKLRSETLHNLKRASGILEKAADKDLEEFKLMFRSKDQSIDLPFWNQINGPIADCLWHVGQIVSFRRASGNPFTEKVNLLNGKVIGN